MTQVNRGYGWMTNSGLALMLRDICLSLAIDAKESGDLDLQNLYQKKIDIILAAASRLELDELEREGI